MKRKASASRSSTQSQDSPASVGIAGGSGGGGGGAVSSGEVSSTALKAQADHIEATLDPEVVENINKVRPRGVGAAAVAAAAVAASARHCRRRRLCHRRGRGRRHRCRRLLFPTWSPPSPFLTLRPLRPPSIPQRCPVLLSLTPLPSVVCYFRLHVTVHMCVRRTCVCVSTNGCVVSCVVSSCCLSLAGAGLCDGARAGGAAGHGRQAKGGIPVRVGRGRWARTHAPRRARARARARVHLAWACYVSMSACACCLWRCEAWRRWLSWRVSVIFTAWCGVVWCGVAALSLRAWCCVWASCGVRLDV
jgi:hypothetical protein